MNLNNIEERFEKKTKKILVRDFLKLGKIEKINFLHDIVDEYLWGYNRDNSNESLPVEIVKGFIIAIQSNPLYPSWEHDGIDYITYSYDTDDIKEVMKNFNIYTNDKNEILEFYHDNEEQFNHFFITFKLNEIIESIEDTYNYFIDGGYFFKGHDGKNIYIF